MRTTPSVLAVLLALIIMPAQTLAGGYANRVVVTGPGIQTQGVAIRVAGCAWITSGVHRMSRLRTAVFDRRCGRRGPRISKM